MRDGTPRWWRLATGAAIILGVLARLTAVTWTGPWEPHHPDEHILPLEALALWEGVTPREIGWPASTTRLLLSTAAGAQWLAEGGRTAWRLRAEPDRALQTITTWIARRYVDPTPLYKLGRTTSIISGILQVIATAWALRQWVGPAGVAIGTLGVAMAPLTVTYSQYVLADITGLLFATIVAGLAANPTPRRMIAMGALSGLAMSSKFHFGLWLLTPLLCVWLQPQLRAGQKTRLSFATIAAAAWVVLTLVPWFSINPLLALKEFAGVVLVKVGNGTTAGGIAANAVTLYAGLGTLILFGGFLGASGLNRNRFRQFAPLLVPLLLGTFALVTSGTVFDRYGLVLLPGLAILSAVGWDTWCAAERRSIRLFALAALATCALVTLTSLVRVEQSAGDADVDVLAKQWIMTHVPRGQRVAVHDENNAFLPREARQLRECVEHAAMPASYLEKWLVEGVQRSVDGGQAMRSVVLNDEDFFAYWCRRELDVQTDPGFHLVPYHSDRRFGSVLERDAVSEFRSGSRQVTGGVDVLVMNRPIDVGVAPAQVVRTGRGQRVIYLR